MLNNFKIIDVECYQNCILLGVKDVSSGDTIIYDNVEDVCQRFGYFLYGHEYWIFHNAKYDVNVLYMIYLTYKRDKDAFKRNPYLFDKINNLFINNKEYLKKCKANFNYYFTKTDYNQNKYTISEDFAGENGKYIHCSYSEAQALCPIFYALTTLYRGRRYVKDTYERKFNYNILKAVKRCIEAISGNSPTRIGENYKKKDDDDAKVSMFSLKHFANVQGIVYEDMADFSKPVNTTAELDVVKSYLKTDLDVTLEVFKKSGFYETLLNRLAGIRLIRPELTFVSKFDYRKHNGGNYFTYKDFLTPSKFFDTLFPPKPDKIAVDEVDEDFKVPSLTHEYNDLYIKDFLMCSKLYEYVDNVKAVVIDGNTLKLTKGGYHSDRIGIFRSTDTEVLVDIDFSSFYPHIILHYLKGLDFPNSDHFSQEKFQELVDNRLKAKHEGDIEKSNILKVQINSVYGSSKLKTSPLYSPNCQLKTCIVGQYLLMHLIKYVKGLISSSELIYVNTDGVTFKIPRTELDLLVSKKPEIVKIFNIDVDYQYIDYLFIKASGTRLYKFSDGSIKGTGEIRGKMIWASGKFPAQFIRKVHEHLPNFSEVPDRVTNIKMLYEYMLPKLDIYDFKVGNDFPSFIDNDRGVYKYRLNQNNKLYKSIEKPEDHVSVVEKLTFIYCQYLFSNKLEMDGCTLHNFIPSSVKFYDAFANKTRYCFQLAEIYRQGDHYKKLYDYDVDDIEEVYNERDGLGVFLNTSDIPYWWIDIDCDEYGDIPPDVRKYLKKYLHVFSTYNKSKGRLRVLCKLPKTSYRLRVKHPDIKCDVAFLKEGVLLGDEYESYIDKQILNITPKQLEVGCKFTEIFEVYEVDEVEELCVLDDIDLKSFKTKDGYRNSEHHCKGGVFTITLGTDRLKSFKANVQEDVLDKFSLLEHDYDKLTELFDNTGRHIGDYMSEKDYNDIKSTWLQGHRTIISKALLKFADSGSVLENHFDDCNFGKVIEAMPGTGKTYTSLQKSVKNVLNNKVSTFFAHNTDFAHQVEKDLMTYTKPYLLEYLPHDLKYTVYKYFIEDVLNLVVFNANTKSEALDKCKFLITTHTYLKKPLNYDYTNRLNEYIKTSHLNIIDEEHLVDDRMIVPFEGIYYASQARSENCLVNPQLTNSDVKLKVEDSIYFKSCGGLRYNYSHYTKDEFSISNYPTQDIGKFITTMDELLTYLNLTLNPVISTVDDVNRIDYTNNMFDLLYYDVEFKDDVKKSEFEEKYCEIIEYRIIYDSILDNRFGILKRILYKDADNNCVADDYRNRNDLYDLVFCSNKLTHVVEKSIGLSASPKTNSDVIKYHTGYDDIDHLIVTMYPDSYKRKRITPANIETLSNVERDTIYAVDYKKRIKGVTACRASVLCLAKETGEFPELNKTVTVGAFSDMAECIGSNNLISYTNGRSFVGTNFCEHVTIYINPQYLVMDLSERVVYNNTDVSKYYSQKLLQVLGRVLRVNKNTRRFNGKVIKEIMLVTSTGNNADMDKMFATTKMLEGLQDTFGDRLIINKVAEKNDSKNIGFKTLGALSELLKNIENNDKLTDKAREKAVSKVYDILNEKLKK